jgi:membrane fusion protein, multidrug efflux system
MSYFAELANPEGFTKDSKALSSRSGFPQRNRKLLAGVAIAVLLAIGYGTWRVESSRADTAPVNAAVPVTVETAAVHNVRIWSDFSGRMVAVDSAEIRPQVSGRITEIRFKDGQMVQAGDILLVIDPRPYEAAVSKAEADLATANNNARLAKIELARATRLKDAQAVAQDFYDQRANANGVSQAAIQSAEAALTQAKVDVDHAYVKAPISGRVSRAEITVGNLVQVGPTAPLLTSIVSNDGIYADLEVDERTYLQSIRSHAATANEESRIPVELRLPGDERVYQGTIESFDNKIDTGSGTIRARARFDNADGSLVPGMFATVRLASAANNNVLLVPEDAVGNDQSKRFVYVVGRDSKAAFREVSLGQDVDGKRVVLSGLKPGEHFIVAGLQRVQPGSTVAAQQEQGRTVAVR